MKRLLMILLCVVAALGISAQSKVYFTKEISPESLVKIYKALGVPAHGRVAVKISTGESGGRNYLKPELIRSLVDEVKGTIVECNTAYPGSRNTTEAHRKTIREHGFDAIAQVDIMDEEGDMRIPVQDTTHIKYDIVGNHLKNYDFMVNLAHFKGHAMGGFGGVLKNASIGVASLAGKTYIHTAGKVQSPDELWQNLPAQDYFLESMAAAAQAVHDHFGAGNIVYIDVMNNMSVDCDCDSHPADPKLKDMGILASADPVALDQACLDLVFNHKAAPGDDNKPLIERINRQHGTHIVDYSERIGLGSRQYELVELK
ncbi:PF04015 domain protein [Bacteroidetes bacterium oral taxon 272 str. F0290]|nr:PF04015 domain protein [Bacteroidetes bacterium oral taxon 272 str. F0290]